jgi:hypothetical protein
MPSLMTLSAMPPHRLGLLGHLHHTATAFADAFQNL